VNILGGVSHGAAYFEANHPYSTRVGAARRVNLAVRGTRLRSPGETSTRPISVVTGSQASVPGSTLPLLACTSLTNFYTPLAQVAECGYFDTTRNSLLKTALCFELRKGP
jgi:hypothetical protein